METEETDSGGHLKEEATGLAADWTGKVRTR